MDGNLPEHFSARNSRPQENAFVEEFIYLGENGAAVGPAQQMAENDNQLLQRH